MLIWFCNSYDVFKKIVYIRLFVSIMNPPINLNQFQTLIIRRYINFQSLENILVLILL